MIRQTYLARKAAADRKELWQSIAAWLLVPVIIGVLGFCLLSLSGCASPYQGQANELAAAYQRGELTADQYHSQLTSLEALDLQRRANISQAFFRFSQGMQQQQYLNQMNRSVFFVIPVTRP
jgi:hypothetical protein